MSVDRIESMISVNNFDILTDRRQSEERNFCMLLIIDWVFRYHEE